MDGPEAKWRCDDRLHVSSSRLASSIWRLTLLHTSTGTSSTAENRLHAVVVTSTGAGGAGGRGVSGGSGGSLTARLLWELARRRRAGSLQGARGGRRACQDCRAGPVCGLTRARACEAAQQEVHQGPSFVASD